MLRWVLTTVVVLCAWSTAAAQPPKVRDAYLFGYPVTETIRTMAALEAQAQRAGRTTVNRLAHRPALAGPNDRAVTAPNNDTLYSSGWLDVSAGPVLLTVPALPDRYHSVAILDMFTDNQAVIGTRANGSTEGRYYLAGPNWRGRTPAGVTLVRLPVNEAWMIARVLVDGPADLAAARAAQAGFTLTATTPVTARPLTSALPRPGDPASFLDRVNEVLGRGPLPPAMTRQMRRLTSAGIRPGERGAFARLPAATQSAWRAQMPELEASLRGGLADVGDTRQGWIYPAPGLGRFGDDGLYRSRIALAGLGALPIEEATYLTAVADAAGRPLDGRRSYRLHVPANVPVDGFWSVTMYAREPDGRTYLAANPIERYSIGNRTPGLLRNADGSIDLLLGSVQPGSGTANWLPAPAGEFRVSFRAYLPKPPFVNGRFALPAIVERR